MNRTAINASARTVAPRAVLTARWERGSGNGDVLYQSVNDKVAGDARCLRFE